ncbi:MAG TPA: hypothetical protein VJO53_09055 [Candidatus Acidoferrales bacterium]|nr:hypothetical protein [Candidatus Acidoferrales bacterium]
MKIFYRPLMSLALAAILASPVIFAGCAARVDTGYRVYDRDHDDYHRWNNNEVVFYSQWENETHRDHRDFRKRNDDDKKEYWKWRHDHSDHDNH